MTEMTHSGIIIVGLGPGGIQDLTLEARRVLLEAAEGEQIVYFRTIIHPTVEPLKQDIPKLRIESFDRLYDESEDWSMLYQQIATEICDRAQEQSILYAVPGHPLIGETSVQLVLQQARARGIATRIVSGLSFIEPVCNMLSLDPFEVGAQIVDATNLATLRPDELAGHVIPTVPLMVVQVYNRRLATEVKLALGEFYPDEWIVKLVRAAGVGEDEAVLEMPLYELDRNNFANHLSTLYVPPVGTLAALRAPETLRSITERLRREPDGCPWDRQQTHETLKRYVIEETYEVVEALEEQNMDKLAEELGDLLLQVYLHAEVARQSDEFTIGDVYEQINAKLIRRHPHVFGDAEVENAGQVVQNWDAIKQQERASAGVDIQQESILDRVPQATPALMVAQEYQKRVAKSGFEFTSLPDVYAKIKEEMAEIEAATTLEEQREEIGDLLFITAKLARFFKIDAEEALRLANRKFQQRFQSMEAIAHEEERLLTSYSTAEWEVLWARAKTSV
ncbi:nucleoside triphosphate pyrophosphohydrolase [Dictyobacter arantiisoli]|uniref:MazG family protein n=1 Tax=Dictyobacter arantiisoli TaxID=2014874 RepID=A0A5A5TG57_9CHLR|nr:nucleoside triphosphate pyrophosphohydrolase [Dictyobacter arantiisoli]GCF10347.1 MazG family protein [Dictyobacter arantiisoli]